VASEAMAPQTMPASGHSSGEDTKHKVHFSSPVGQIGGNEKPTVEVVCLADLRKGRLRYDGWSPRPATQISLAWAPSTLASYDSITKKLASYCKKCGVEFPPSTKDIPVFADFLCHVSDSSERPSSILRSTSAAISNLYQALGQDSPMHDPDLLLLITALIKSGTHAPSTCTKVMPITPFNDLFQGWPDDEHLSIAELRLKTITLLALSFMTRPSDLAPKACKFDPDTMELQTFNLTTDMVRFHEGGSMTLQFFGIKNDTDRSGFEVQIPGSSLVKCDPVRSLSAYLQRTQKLRCPTTKPLFAKLSATHSAIKAPMVVAKILKEAIDLAGLGGQGYTPRSFRPTGATAAIKAGVLPETAMQIGRWKTREVFFGRYVYPQAPDGYSEDIMRFGGVSDV
jgi:hypothetical protein